MHKNTKLTPVIRKEVYKKWRTGEYSLRQLGLAYHVDKKVISRIIERGKKGDFSVHSSINKRFQKKTTSKKPTKPKKKRLETK